MAHIAYVRVSTEEQNEARQLEALEKRGIDKWFTEKISAKDMNRPQLNAMLDYVREGDTVYIHDFSRLARSTKDLLAIVRSVSSTIFRYSTFSSAVNGIIHLFPSSLLYLIKHVRLAKTISLFLLIEFSAALM